MKLNKLSIISLVFVAMFILSSCSQNLPRPQKIQNHSEHPVITKQQEEAIRNDTLETIANAQKANDPDMLDSRLSGPALKLTKAQINIAKASNSSIDVNAKIPSAVRQVIISNDVIWPRNTMAITDLTDDLQTERLLVFNQENAREKYKLWGVVRLFTGVSMPSFEVPEIGSHEITAGDTTVLDTPANVLAQYASVLQDGENSSFAPRFQSDALRQEIQNSTASAKDGLESAKGSQIQAFTPLISEIRGIHTADGGAIVVGEIDSNWTRRTGNASNATPASDAEKALWGAKTATSGISAKYLNIVAFYIPPRSSTATIQVLGAERLVIDINPE